MTSDSPARYTHGHHDAVLRSHRWRTATNSAAYLLDHLPADATLLDVGCGPGTLTVDLARHRPDGRVVGIDTSPEVIEQARDHAHDAGTDVDLRTCSLHDLDPATERYDVVHAHQVLHHLPDPVGALRAMAALVRPGGLVAVREADYETASWTPPDERLDRWLRVTGAVTRRNGGSSDAGRRLPGWARAAGLGDATYTTSTWTFVAPDERTWWADLWAERTLHTRLGEHALAHELATTTDLAEIAAGWAAWATADDAVFTVVHGELLARP